MARASGKGERQGRPARAGGQANGRDWNEWTTSRGGDVGDEVQSQVWDRTITWMDRHLVG